MMLRFDEIFINEFKDTFNDFISNIRMFIFNNSNSECKDVIEKFLDKNIEAVNNWRSKGRTFKSILSSFGQEGRAIDKAITMEKFILENFNFSIDYGYSNLTPEEFYDKLVNYTTSLITDILENCRHDGNDMIVATEDLYITILNELNDILKEDER